MRRAGPVSSAAVLQTNATPDRGKAQPSNSRLMKVSGTCSGARVMRVRSLLAMKSRIEQWVMFVSL